MEVVILYDLISKMNMHYNVHLIMNNGRVYVGFAKDIPFKFFKCKVLKILIYGCDYVVTIEGV